MDEISSLVWDSDIDNTKEWKKEKYIYKQADSSRDDNIKAAATLICLLLGLRHQSTFRYVASFRINSWIHFLLRISMLCASVGIWSHPDLLDPFFFSSRPLDWIYLRATNHSGMLIEKGSHIFCCDKCLPSSILHTQMSGLRSADILYSICRSSIDVVLHLL